MFPPIPSTREVQPATYGAFHVVEERVHESRSPEPVVAAGVPERIQVRIATKHIMRNEQQNHQPGCPDEFGRYLSHIARQCRLNPQKRSTTCVQLGRVQNHQPGTGALVDNGTLYTSSIGVGICPELGKQL